MSKKAQGLSMNVIIIAAIALLVLVILAVLILRAGTQVSDQTACEGVGGGCFAIDSCADLGGLYASRVVPCPDGQICCVKLIEGEE